MKKLVSIVVPCYNEEASLPKLYEEVCKLMDAEDHYRWELLFINDGSHDKTINILKKLYLQVHELNLEIFLLYYIYHFHLYLY